MEKKIQCLDVLRIQGVPDLKWPCEWQPLSVHGTVSSLSVNTLVLGSRINPLCCTMTQHLWVIKTILDWGTTFCHWEMENLLSRIMCLSSECMFLHLCYLASLNQACLHREASALLDPMECTDMAEEQRVHSPPASLVPRIHVILAQKLQHINPLLPTCLNKEESRTCKCKCWSAWMAVHLYGDHSPCSAEWVF